MRAADNGRTAMLFENRVEAGRRLAERLARYKEEQPVVLALPRGGVPVAAEIATALGAPLDLILVRKLGVPYQPELAMGAVVDGATPHVVRNEEVIQLAGVSEADFAVARERELAEIERRRERYLGGRERLAVEDRTAIVVDDGIATGATARAAMHAVRAAHPKRLVLAVPVAPPDVLAELRADADEVVCIDQPEPFMAISLYYSDFRQVSDEEVTAILALFPPGTGKPSGTAAPAVRPPSSMS